MPGLTFSNELISRDEALHTEFTILLYSKLQKQINKNRIYEIIKEAVEIEKEFICRSITLQINRYELKPYESIYRIRCRPFKCTIRI